MHIDRQCAQTAFLDYVRRYDLGDSKIALKVAHTERVAELCDAIARSQGWPSPEVDLAWVCGLLHDIGRFEQVRSYGTFSDAASVSHAQLGTEVLFGEGGIIGDFVQDKDLYPLIEDVVAWHSDFRLPPDMDGRTRRFADLLRDADKIDILQTFCESDPEAVLNLKPGSIAASPMGQAAREAFWERRTCKRDERVFPADYIVSYACFVFELVYPQSRAIAHRQGHVYELLSRPFSDAQTKSEAERMLACVKEHLTARPEQ